MSQSREEKLEAILRKMLLIPRDYRMNNDWWLVAEEAELLLNGNVNDMTKARANVARSYKNAIRSL